MPDPDLELPHDPLPHSSIECKRCRAEKRAERQDNGEFDRPGW